jgi:hypothetical protein
LQDDHQVSGLACREKPPWRKRKREENGGNERRGGKSAALHVSILPSISLAFIHDFIRRRRFTTVPLLSTRLCKKNEEKAREIQKKEEEASQLRAFPAAL